MFRRFSVAILLSLASLTGIGTSIAAKERPTAPRLLPEKTLAYVRVEDVDDLKEGFADSGLGRMMKDEKMKPLISDFYVAGEQLFAEASQFLGVSLDELLSIPQGEIAFAVVPLDYDEPKDDAPKDDSPDAIRARIEARRNRSPVGFIGLIDTAENAGYMRSIIENVEREAIGSGVKKSVRTVAGTDVVTYERASGNGMPLAIAERDGVFVIGAGAGLVGDVLNRWDGDVKSPSLAQNTDFGNVMSHCIGAEATRPQLTFYADPYTLVEKLVKANGGAAGFVWPILENLQIDKIKGVGGSTFAGTKDEFEGIMHIHVLIESPRDGLFSVVRPGQGSTIPESWVPGDIVGYSTLHWDVLKTYEGIGRIIGRFQSADFMEQTVEKQFKDRTKLDLRKDILEQLTGRLGILRWNELPMRLNSNTQIWSVEVKDAEKARETLESLADVFIDTLEKENFGGTTVYLAGGPENGNFPENIRRPEPALAIIGNYVIASDSRKAIEHIIETNNGIGSKLVDSPDYALIAGEISGKLDAEEPFLFSYMKNEEIFRQLYEVALDPGSRQFLRNVSEQNTGAKTILEILEKNEMPAFSVFSKYFAPSGAFAYDDPTGLHYATFTLRPIE